MTAKLPQPDDAGRDGSVEAGDDDLDLLADELDYGLADDDGDGPSWGLIAGVLVAMVAIAFVVFDGLQSETYFFEVHEAVERSDSLVGETIRIRGDVEPGTLEGGNGQLENRFAIASEGKSISIVYHRALPDTFEEDSEVVAQGRLDENMVLHADEVLVKCPSRYEGDAPAPEGEHDGYEHIDDSTNPRAAR